MTEDEQRFVLQSVSVALDARRGRVSLQDKLALSRSALALVSRKSAAARDAVLRFLDDVGGDAPTAGAALQDSINRLFDVCPCDVDRFDWQCRADLR